MMILKSGNKLGNMMISDNIIFYRMRKKYLLLMFLFSPLNMNSIGKDSLMIRYCSWDRQPTHLSTCYSFEVENGYKNEYIIPCEFADTLKSLLSNLKATEDIYFPVGCKLYFFHNDSVIQKVCLNRNYIFQNGRTYHNNDTIVHFITNLMSRFSPNENSNNKFLPNAMGANYEGGVKKLYSTLQDEFFRISAKANYSGAMIMIIRCKADKEGHTIYSEVKIVNPRKPSQKEQLIAQKLNLFIKNNVFWIRNCDRSDYDNIVFSFRFRAHMEADKNLKKKKQ